VAGNCTKVVVADFWKQLFDPNAFMPHIHCYLWNTGLVRLHVISDLAIGFSYVAISITLAWLIWRARQDVPFSWMFLSFGAFILACGATHFVEVWTLWTPLYWLAGLLKAVTAGASVITAVLLPSLIPKAIDLIRLSKETEAANHELRQKAAVLENSAEAVVSLSLDCRITGWNCAAERMFGYTAHEVAGRPISILAPPELSRETQEAVRRYMTGEGPSSFETVRVRKNGDKFEVNEILSLTMDRDGKVREISLVKRDITKRKLGEEILRVAVEAAPNAIVMADQAGKIRLVNAQTEILFGYAREELLGQSVEVLVPERDRRGHPVTRSEFMAHPPAGSTGAARELCGLRKDGSEFPVEIGLNQIRMSGETWVLSAIVDITERKRAREAILQANEDLERRVNERTEELSRANADLEAFSYTVAHDLRAPLRHIAGFANLLALECRGEMSDEARRHLERVQNGAQSMGNLIDALLHLARIGRQPVSPKPTALNALVDAALAGLAPELAGRKIEWRIRDLGIADCDPGLMQQVFVNLLSNAIKYTRLQEIAQIEVARSTVDGEPVFFVRDNGAGFDMQYAGRLFDVFHRLHKARDFEGTGVGLATVQRIIHNHGGRVWAHAEMGKGATFSFAVPEVCAKKMELA
jgi:PAS domain S-box-containing protein